MKTVVEASRNTWIPLLPYDVKYFVGSNAKQDSSWSLPPNVIRLSAFDNDYPPVNKTFDMWSYLYHHHSCDYDYFIVVDSDTYVNAKVLQSMMNSMTCKDCYTGYLALGAEFEQHILGLRAPYCSGVGYVIAHNTLRKFGPHIEECRSSIAAKHSDTELGRCIYQYASNLSCTWANVPLGLVTITIDKQGFVKQVRGNNRGQTIIDFPAAPPTEFFRAGFIHPVKEPQFVYQFHHQLSLELRPVLHPIFINGSCVANPIIQNETYPQNIRVPECRLSEPKIIINTNDTERLRAFVITLPNHEDRANRVIQAFQRHNIQLEIFYGISGVQPPRSSKLTIGEWNLRLTMTRLMEKLISTEFEHILIFEDDAIPHRRFSELFPALIKDRRCSESASHGILMLGTTIRSDGWDILDSYNNSEVGLCRNVCTKTFGSFASLLHRSTFKSILDWLKSDTSSGPYDLIFAHLARLGYPVRFASPDLVSSGSD